MANAPQMKIPIGADTSDFDKGARKVKQEMKDLEKVSGDAFGAIGGALGVDTRQFTQFSSALSGLGRSLQQTGTEGQKAFGSILSSIAPLAGAIAGIGIAGATLAFKSLNSEAEAFKNTVAGANMEMATAAYIDTYRQALRDMNKDTGKAVAETQSAWKKMWGTLGATVKQAWRSGLFVGGEEGPSQQAIDDFLNKTGKANDLAATAEEITNQIYLLERKRKEQAVEIAKLNAQIADKMSIARDSSRTVAERQKAVQEAEDLIAQKKAKQVPLEQDLANLYRERSKLATDSVEAADAVLAQDQRVFDVERAITEQSNGLLRVKNSIAKAAKTQAEAAAEEAAALAKIAASRAALAANPLPSLPGITGQATTQASVSLAIKPETIESYKKVISTSLGDTTVYIGFRADMEKLRDITSEVESIVSGLAESTGEVMGKLIGDLATGGDAWANFKDAALSAFGDMAISVGKMAIATGTATLGIKAALESLNGYVAIAAGIALVALGQAVKTGLSNVANGNYSAGGGIAATSTSTYNSDYTTKEVEVNVTGTLKADGNQLIAVIQNTQNRNSYTR